MQPACLVWLLEIHRSRVTLEFCDLAEFHFTRLPRFVSTLYRNCLEIKHGIPQNRKTHKWKRFCKQSWPSDLPVIVFLEFGYFFSPCVQKINRMTNSLQSLWPWKYNIYKTWKNLKIAQKCLESVRYILDLLQFTITWPINLLFLSNMRKSVWKE